MEDVFPYIVGSSKYVIPVPTGTYNTLINMGLGLH